MPFFDVAKHYFRKGEVGNYFVEWMKAQVQVRAPREIEDQQRSIMSSRDSQISRP